MLLGVLGAASGSAGFILEGYWSFLTALSFFAEESLAFGCLPNPWTLLSFVFTNVNNFLSSGIFNSLFFCQNLYFSWAFHACFHSFIVLQNLQFFSFGWLMQRTATSCSSVRLLFQIGPGPLFALLERGVCEQPQVKFLS